jgi:outer membrane lipoprotein SlyB
MMPKFALTALLALSAFAPVEPAAAQNSLGGAIFGGAAGAVVGGAVGGGRGAAIGAIVGATTGAAIASQGEPRQAVIITTRTAAMCSGPTARGSR